MHFPLVALKMSKVWREVSCLKQEVEETTENLGLCIKHRHLLLAEGFFCIKFPNRNTQ